ncbi:hypothetical protein [Polynucleobacter nymphae]|uniref:hypothetical protein n=1 Tax=Polynucleobacter nymphae TaxID=2081043 RepID=UPI001C0DBA9A|nr:hypothetical protein [Polynucleobacter nymphae]MBU3607784.1 hypothetical protein [Polynucleobacter nymphae]
MQSTQNDRNNNSDQNSTSQNEGEISLIDIVNFVQESWKKLLAASIVGAVLGLTGWFFLGSYQAEYVLFNINSVDLISWKNLQKSLPNLAAQVVEENKIPQDQAAVYKTMAQEQWWQKNVAPAYALSKADTKDLGAISKDLDAASTTILSLTITAAGSSKEKAIDNVRNASQFLRSGGAYLQLHSLLNGYESQTISEVANLQQKITTTQIEMGYQQERAKSLEDLHKRFPGGVNVNGQVVDPKDSGAKYMPISTQIIAVNNDINASKESLARLSKRLEQIAIIKTFIDQAIPLQDQTFDGLALNEQLLAIESALRSKLAKGDSNGQALLDQLRAQLLSIQVRFTKGLEANTAPVATKKGMIKTTAGGLAAAFFLMLLALLGQQLWIKIKNGSAQ